MSRSLLILLACGAAAAAPFSHKLHLGLKLECTTCHAAAAASAKAEDNLQPAKTACQDCHTDIGIPAPPTTRVVHFSHAQHLKMGNVAPVIASAIDKKNYLQPVGEIRRHLDTKNACEACHRGLEESTAVTPAAMPQMADCLVCHSQNGGRGSGVGARSRGSGLAVSLSERGTGLRSDLNSRPTVPNAGAPTPTPDPRPRPQGPFEATSTPDPTIPNAGAPTPDP